jgi:predicted metal-binding protein
MRQEFYRLELKGEGFSMINRSELELLITGHGYRDFKWIQPKDIVVAQWVRMKCLFGCPDYGKTATCPPNVPSVSDCRKFFDEYETAVVLHFEKKVDKPEDRHAWSKGVNQELLRLEKAILLSGHVKTFLLFMDSCSLCADCPGAREECKNPKSARPSPESLAMDVFSTVKKYGYPVEVLSEYSQTMNRYAFLLIE